MRPPMVVLGLDSSGEAALSTEIREAYYLKLDSIAASVFVLFELSLTNTIRTNPNNNLMMRRAGLPS